MAGLCLSADCRVSGSTCRKIHMKAGPRCVKATAGHTSMRRQCHWSFSAARPRVTASICPIRAPHIYIVLSPGEEADDPEMVVHLITACPYEAEGYTEDTDQLVEGVLMPSEIAAWIKTFCDTHHKDVPFKKRKRKPYDPRKGDFGAHRKPGGG